MPFFSSPDGVRLHYELEGSGPPLILHLGAGADAELWREAGYVEPLTKSYTCVLFDHRGHGPSDRPTSIEANHIARYADDVAALIDHLGRPSASFVGWSNGSLVGLRAAEDNPRLFDGLVLLGGIGRRASAEEIASNLENRVPAMRAKGWSLILDRMQAAEKLPVPRWFLDRVYATDTGPWIAFTESMKDWKWSPWDAMPVIDAPTLLMAGELEDPEDILAEVAAAMPHATRIRIPEREHINAFLCSEFVVPRVLEFLRTKTPQATG